MHGGSRPGAGRKRKAPAARNTVNRAPASVAEDGLGEESRALFGKIVEAFGIDDPAGREILLVGLQARDRLKAAQARIAQGGLIVSDRYGQLKAHPALAIEREARNGWLAALRVLKLDGAAGEDF